MRSDTYRLTTLLEIDVSGGEFIFILLELSYVSPKILIILLSGVTVAGVL